LFAVGDVSGHGVQATTVMARLHFAIRAYAVDGDDPATILQKLSSLVNVSQDGHFATVLCGEVDVAARSLTLANAGHPPALVVAQTGEYLSSPVGPPVGVAEGVEYPTRTFQLPDNATLIVYTDGLIERRGENPDIGLGRLQSAVAGVDGSVSDLVAAVIAAVAAPQTEDDMVVLGLRWLE
jgi:serine phosphatase RsbU (regulator of sigma subunit)